MLLRRGRSAVLKRRAVGRHARLGTWRKEQRKTPRRRAPYLLGVVGFVVFFVAVWGWQVRDVVVVGATMIPNGVLRDAALASLEGRRWGLVPRRSVLFGIYRGVGKLLSESFALEAITLDLQRGGILAVTVREQDIAAVVHTDEGGTTLLSVTGSTIIATSPELVAQILTADLERRILIFRATVPQSALGAQPYQETQIAHLRGLWDELDQTGGSLRPEVIVAKYGSQTDFDIHTVSGAIIATTTGVGADAQLTKLRAVLRDRPSQREQAAIRSVDLRFSDRVYIQ